MSDNVITLTGCKTTPLVNYLKALAVFRITSIQKDPSVRCFWQDDFLNMIAPFTIDNLIDFFLEEYKPAPIIAPWNSSAGFSPPDEKEGEYLRFIKSQTSLERLKDYREIILIAEKAIRHLEITDSKSLKENKNALCALLRKTLPDSAIPWLDATIIITSTEKGKPDLNYPPLLGTGANDGRLDFTVNFMKNLKEILTNLNTSKSRAWLKDALLGLNESQGINNPSGFFSLSAAGGPNTDQGFEGESVLNPWDFILMIEGTILFAGSVSRRFSVTEAQGKAAFPFTVNPSAVGFNSYAAKEESTSRSRGELWVPVWKNPVSLVELENLYGEGRARLGRRLARNGLDFARSIASLGTARGVDSFIRYSFLKRRGDSHIAVPLRTYKTRKIPLEGVNLIDQIDNWIISAERAVSGAKTVPHSIVSSLYALKESIHSYTVHGQKRDFQKIVVNLGKLERAIASSKTIKSTYNIRPLFLRDVGWIKMCDDGSHEFRIAASVVSIQPAEEKIGPLRANLEPVTVVKDFAEWEENSKQVVPVSNDVYRTLISILERRIIEALKHELEFIPIAGTLHCSAHEIKLFLDGRLDGEKILSLILGLSLIHHRIFAYYRDGRKNGESEPRIPRDYIVLKTQFLPSSLSVNNENISFPYDLTLFSLLSAGRVKEACKKATQRLRNAGFLPLSAFGVSGCDPHRLLASMIIPIQTEKFAMELLPMAVNKGSKFKV